MVVPKKEKYRKQFRGKMRGIATRGYRLAFGDFGLKAMGRSWLTEQQLEAARQAIVHKTKREGKVWIRVIHNQPITSKPLGVTMGGGKGEVLGHVAVILPGRIIFEVGGLPESLAKEALHLAGSKLPFKTKIVGE
ncbi:50S ribosomal protein L16 [Candidatus Shapirobacteria bacterium CG09_land_8_20_14_0_10_38_17]|uniref:Large ribosomal subunit protein uL16 n=1 Tax=Candidatus Shapirobacteria bacterium CG09_land_8_20_14_0_10_38_17 TaxID=1974884 RepID=A0A2H0WU09_9BACT|nr:MAG: 50S ribosomal protein L16 [Candidatus Shapirobacteria bacterium CG09_land_8_20_14_0_10_38_17]